MQMLILFLAEVQISATILFVLISSGPVPGAMVARLKAALTVCPL